MPNLAAASLSSGLARAQSGHSWSANSIRATLAPAGGSAIRFEGVDFAYPGARRPALQDVVLAIPAGGLVEGFGL